MSERTLPALFKLPNSSNGHVLAVLLPTSMTLSVAAIIVQLIDPAVLFYQLFMLITIAPLTLLHHVVIIWLLYKHRDKTIKSSLVPESLTRKTNISFMVLFEVTWLAGTGVGFSWFGLGYSPTDMVTNKALAMASNIVGLAESFVFLAFILFCIRARNERLRAPHELRLTGEY
ncbi:unnamed protein product [Rhizoctonia solani]|uniref:Uncharacterized protein n=1 Tax=Rhizoctonia solani TaxID=456999 RepID=A0A8H3B9M6_9AGAM|nr:unnamed protein product [Rhizoctonia solani]